MLWRRIPFFLWPMVVRYYVLRLLGTKPSPILSNWIYFLRLSLPLMFSVRKHGKDYLVVGPNNLKTLLRPTASDILVFNQIYFRGEYQLLNTVDLILPHKPVIVDLGANVGLFMCFAKARWVDATVIGIEPDGGNYLQAEKQIDINKFANATMLKAGIWTENGRLALQNAHEILEWSFKVEENQLGEIEGITLSFLLQNFELEIINLLKIDIEGTEVKLFGNDEFLLTLKEHVQNLIMETHSQEDQKQIASTLEQHGFSVVHERELIFAKNSAL
jgi:FkbM family methyltransferase